MPSASIKLRDWQNLPGENISLLAIMCVLTEALQLSVALTVLPVAVRVLEAALTSRHQDHRRLETPWLDISYRSYDTLPWRPTGPRPTGACLDPWPPSQPNSPGNEDLSHD